MSGEIEAALSFVGCHVKDVVTGTKGVCDAVSFGLYGDIKASVCRPDRVSDWYEIKRIIKVHDRRVLPPPQFFPRDIGS